MRLLNTKTYKVQEFYTKIPLYAILSHTWGNEEITFQDIQKGLDTAKNKAGWSKVRNACLHATKYKFDWIWIDSCCIDKSSSAELSEAINSMYQYYEDAEVCYIYLCDASSKEDPRDPRSAFRNSRWFMRGWTLQELIVPLYAVFLADNADGASWTEIGTRWSLRHEISAITSIPIEVFEGCSIDEYSIAQRMSWAAFRETTRPEDQAYCLMGIFNVSMPPIYGEGRAKAFMRLQQEIIKISDDRSIFAWTSNSRDTGELRGLLARSPEEFRASGGVKISETDLIGDASSFSFANNGLRIHLPIVSTDDLEVGDSFLASLHCQTEKDGITSHLSIFLRRIGEKKYVRYRPNMVALMPSRSDSQDLKEVIVKENSLPRKTRRKSHGPSPYIFHLKVLPPAQCLLDMDNIRHSGTAPGNAPGPSEAVRYDGNGTKIEVSEDAFAQLHLTYHDGQLSRLFYVAFGVQNNISTIDVIPEQLHRDHSTLINDIPVDRASLHLTNLGLLTVSLQMTGRYSARVLEINYHRFMDQESSEKTLQTKLQPPSLGFRVPLFIQYYFYESALLSLTDVFPPSFFDRGLKSSRSSESYIAMHPNIPFRLLTYKDDKFNLKLHVAIGFQATGDAWTDIFTHERFDVDEQKKHEDIWKSYFDSGLWRQVSSQSTSSDILFGWNVTATVQSSRTLQLGSHSLLLRID